MRAGRGGAEATALTHRPGEPVDCSVVVVNYQTDDALAECLASVARTTKGLGVECIVVDNSASLAVAGFADRFPAVRLVENRANVGFAAAANQGIRLARGRHVLCLNPDTLVHDGAVATLVAYLDARPDVGAVGGRLLESDGSLQYSCRRFPGYFTIFFGRYAVLTRLLPGNAASRDYMYLDWDHRSVREVDWLSGACLMVRSEVIAATGGFDEGYFLFVEDMDWCRRIRDAGWRVVYVPDAVVTHHIGASRGAVPPRVVWARHRGMLRYVRKHFGAPRPVEWAVAAALGVRGAVLTAAYVVRRRRARR
jgi:GT2 family glycosyltransferase